MNFIDLKSEFVHLQVVDLIEIINKINYFKYYFIGLNINEKLFLLLNWSYKSILGLNIILVFVNILLKYISIYNF